VKLVDLITNGLARQVETAIEPRNRAERRLAKRQQRKRGRGWTR
jgi:hypothetical protein